MRETRQQRMDRRVNHLLAVAGEPLGGADIWLILGGSSGRVYMSLARLEREGRVTSQKYPDGRRKYRAVP